MKLAIASSVILLASAQSPSRYFVGLFDSPLGEEHMPYPVDQCVNVAVGLTGTSHGVYACSDDGTSISYIHYDDDASCTDTTKATTGPVYTMEGLQSGDLFSFNCFGTDSYIELKSMVNDPTCCNGSPTITKIATDACYRDELGNYALTTCDGTTSVQYAYGDSTCDPGTVLNDTPDFEVFSDQCVIFDTAFLNTITVYSVLNRCVVDGESLAEPVFCGDKIGTSTSAPIVKTTALPAPSSSTLNAESPDNSEPSDAKPLLSTQKPIPVTTESPRILSTLPSRRLL